MNWLEGMEKKRPPPGAAMVRSVNYASSPLLASKTPPWRSKFLVAMVGLGPAVHGPAAVRVLRSRSATPRTWSRSPIPVPTRS